MTAQLVKHKEVIVYSMEQCPHCKDAKNMLTNWGIPYTVIDIKASPENWAEFEKLGARSVPQIIVGGTNVGSFQNLARLTVTDFVMEKEKSPTYITRSLY